MSLDNELKDIIEDLQIDRNNEQKNKSYAFVVFCNKLINNIEDNNESQLDLTEGSDDFDIDAIHFDDDNNVCNIIQTKLYENENKAFSFNDIEKALNHIHNFCTGKKDFDLYNDVLKDKYNIFQEKAQKLNEVIFYYIANIEKQEDNKIDKIINDFNSKEKDIKVKLIDINDLRDRYRDFIQPKQPNFNYNLQFDIGENDIDKAIIKHSMGDINTYSFFIQYNDFIDFLLEYKKQCKKVDYLFEKNIRNYFGTKNNNVNKEILETIKDESKRKYFGLLNNGITIICEYANFNSLGSKKNIEIRNPQIINGQQTTRTLLLACEQGTIRKESNFKIFIRLHEMNKDCIEKHGDIIDLITNSTNNQTPIITADMLANNKHIIELERIFDTSKSGIKLIRKRDNHTIKNNEIRLENALKLWYCIYDPIKSKNSKSKIIEEVFNHFSGNNNSDHIKNIDKFYKDILFCSILYSKIIKKQTSKLINKYPFIQHSNELLIYLINKDIDENNKIDKQLIINDIINDQQQILKIRDEALEKINNYLQKLDISKNSYNSIFKNNKIFEALKETSQSH